MPPELAALAGQLPPQARQGVTALYRNAMAGDVSLTSVLNPDSEAGARALKGYFKDLAQSAPTKELAELFKAASQAVMSPEQRREMARAAQEMQEAILRLVMARQLQADVEARALLQSLRMEDVESAKDLLTSASRALETRQANRLSAEELMAAGLVTAIALPVVSQSKLESVTNSALTRRHALNAGGDERLAKDAMETTRGHASEFQLEDLPGPARGLPDVRAVATNHLQRMRDFAN